MSHVCHALRCNAPVPPKMFMCRQHWFMLPKPMRDKVWALYRDGQEVRKNPTRAYLDYAMACVNYVADVEGIPRVGAT